MSLLDAALPDGLPTSTAGLLALLMLLATAIWFTLTLGQAVAPAAADNNGCAGNIVHLQN